MPRGAAHPNHLGYGSVPRRFDRVRLGRALDVSKAPRRSADDAHQGPQLALTLTCKINVSA